VPADLPAAGVQPDTDALLTGALVNADGHGFAIVAGRRLDRLIVQRGLDGEAVIDAFIAARLQHPQGPALFHSRLATHGDTTLDNCHPFTLGGDTRTVLAHNGVLPAEDCFCYAPAALDHPMRTSRDA
jgi:predicted glutamine amidotransferase